MPNLKDITELPVADKATDGLFLLANDNGTAKQIPASTIAKVKTVNGVEPDNNGNVLVDTSWNDLKDKPFYTEEVEEVVLPRIELDCTSHKYEEDNGYIATPFVLGRHYIVVFDGVEYECVGTNIAMGSTSYAVGIGNPHLVSNKLNVSNGMPFAINSHEDSDFEWCTCYDVEAMDEVHTFEIRQKVETVHTIEPKYLPCDLMFKVGCTGTAHPKWNPANMTKPTIVSGSLEAVLEKLANGEIPVVKVQYMGVWDKNYTVPMAYGGEFACDTWLYNTAVMFAHLIANCSEVLSVRISMDLDDPDFMELRMYCHSAGTTPLVIS